MAGKSGYVGILSFELFFPDNHSLKGKRKELLSLKAQLGRRFGASVAEVDHHDVWQRSRLTLACVAREQRELVELLDGAERYVGAQAYELIRVDSEQRWVWMGRPVASRVKTFFLESLGWEPAIRRWFFEYQVNAEWWDKSYLDAEATPLIAITVREQGGALEAVLNTGSSVELDLETLRLDERERLFCRSRRLGEVLLADAVRFSILRHANEACDAVLIAGRWRPLHWPPSVSA